MVDGPVTQRVVKSATKRQLLVGGGGALIALIVLIGGYFVYDQFTQRRADSRQAAQQAVANTIAEDLHQHLSGHLGTLRSLSTEPSVLQAFASGGSKSLQAKGDELVGLFEGALKLRLLSPHTNRVDNSVNPPLTFASLEMLNRVAANRTSVPPEVHLLGRDNEHLVMVEPVLDANGGLAGYLHLSLNAEILQQVLGATAPGGVYVELHQALSQGDPMMIAKHGGAQAPRGITPASAPLPGRIWSIVYWGIPGKVLSSDRMRADDIAQEIDWKLIAAAMAMLLGLGVLIKLRRGGAADDHVVVYQGAIKAILEGAHPGLERLVPGLSALMASGGVTGTTPTDIAARVAYEAEDVTQFTAAPSDQDKAPTVPEPETQDARPPVSESQTLADAAAGISVELIDEDEEDEAEAEAESAGTEVEVDVDEIDQFEQTMAMKIDVEAEVAALTTQEIPAQDTSAMKTQELPAQPNIAIPAVIFRAYDIRGVVGEQLTSESVYEIGRALGSEAYERGQQGIVVARDGRHSSPELASALVKGLVETGRDVIDIGLAPTPVLYFATHYLDTLSGVMVTGSHNPGHYNGLKIVLDGEALSGDAIQAIRNRITESNYTTGTGSQQSAEIVPEYVRRISEDIPVALGNAFKIVVDCGNGVAGVVAPQLLRALGHDVIELYCEVDGSFPNHHPDPSQPANLQDLIDMVQLENADFGLAFDGDGDRLGVVDSAGNIIWPDQQMILFARDVLSRNAGADIIFDVKCSRNLSKAIVDAGGNAVMWKTGHSLIKSKMRETGAPLAGEMSGHIFFKERWYGFDDALYSAARLVEILINEERPPLEVFAELPSTVATPELRIDMPESEHTPFMERLVAAANFDDGKAITIDGLRVDLADAWGLVRPSNTTPCLVLRFEADDEAALKSIQERFRELLLGLESDLKLPF